MSEEFVLLHRFRDIFWDKPTEGERTWTKATDALTCNVLGIESQSTDALHTTLCWIFL